ncbi:hypothetical protein Ddye_011362 [Dipteronia dyeriana]|uniref:Vinorine synthase-like n=1 Tax=Dipteronia dyeriana TaxID=168575 RepID=A0AAE0CGU1_9ROSI|nr:hypothetical protein Ddye_011362 [Dipteronia dyeriana]
MEVPISIISREIIKPSSPTPNHLRIHKFSRVDQINLDIAYPIILFYNSGAHKNSSSHHLKQSLSKILTHYYPFAGRVKDHFSVECDDYGVSFIEAHIATNISEALQNPHPLLLEQLMPYKPHELITTTQFNLAVQVSYFGCGGVAICVCFRHCIADAAAAANFIKSWSAVASRGDSNTDAIVKDVVFDFSSIFPPEDWSGLSITINSEEILKSSSTDIVFKRFVFDGSKMAALRETIGNRPTRFEAVFALMWKAVTSANTEGDVFVASIPVNLRRKMNPPISDQCMGNIFAVLIANWPLEETINYKDFVEKIRELSSLLNDDYIKKSFPNGWILRHMKNIDAGINDDTKSSRRRIFHISSCCGLPFYEADFGWGKPNWVTTLQAHNAGDNIFVSLADTCDGKGVEAWVAMSKQEMAKFEQDSQVIAYASFNQIA